MVLMAAVENDHRRGAKVTSTQSNSMAGPLPRPLPSSTSRARLHDFSFPTLSWGTHRVLRCSKNGPAASSPAPAPGPSSSPETLSPDEEKKATHRPERRGGGGSLLQQRQRGAAQRPWNLRTRRSATAAPTRRAGSDEEAQDAADGAPVRTTVEAKKRASSFSIALSKQEIAEDFAAIRGTRPPRRPKKRPRTVQRQLDLLYPGLCLVDVAPGSYKIEER